MVMVNERSSKTGFHDLNMIMIYKMVSGTFLSINGSFAKKHGFIKSLFGNVLQKNYHLKNNSLFDEHALFAHPF